MTSMKTTLVALIVAALGIGLDAAKPGTKDPTPDWPCVITFRDVGGDAIKSDGLGAYVNGYQGVLCDVTQEPTSGHDQWLNLHFDTSKRTPSPRKIFYAAQTGAGGWAAFFTQGWFQVKKFGTVTSGSERRPFRAYVQNAQFSKGVGRLRGDSDSIESTSGSSSVIVTPGEDGCTWTVRFDPNEPPGSGESGVTVNPRVMEMTEGQFYDVVRGVYPMAFEVTVTVTGVKTGCGGQ